MGVPHRKLDLAAGDGGAEVDAVGSVLRDEEPRRLAARLGQADRSAEVEIAAGRHRWQLLDPLDADAAEAEPVEDRRARGRDRERGADGDDEHRQRDRDRPAKPRAPLAEPPPDGRSEIRSRRELDVPAELPEDGVVLRHSSPAGARAHARCAT